MINPSTIKRIDRLLKKGYLITVDQYVNKALLTAIEQHEIIHQKNNNMQTTKKAAKKKVAKKKTALPKGKSRSAKTGEYVTKKYAAKHKATTVTEKK